MSLWSSVAGANMDTKRILAHVLPGFILFAALVMIFDIISAPQDRISTNFILKPASNTSAIETFGTFGLFLGLIFGIMIDGLGHNIFEHHFFKLFRDYKSVQRSEDKALKYWMNRLSLGNYFNERTADYLYEFADTKQDGTKEANSLKKNLIDDYYSFQEFYLNSGISILLTSFVIPIYLLAVLHMPTFGAIAGFMVALGISTALIFTSYHTHTDYRQTRIAMLEARLRQREREKQLQAPLRLFQDVPNLYNSPPVARDVSGAKVGRKAGNNGTNTDHRDFSIEILSFNPYSKDLEITSVTSPIKGGKVNVLNGGKLLRYTPSDESHSDYVDKFEFTLKDGSGRTDTGMISIYVLKNKDDLVYDLEFSEKAKNYAKAFFQFLLIIAVPTIAIFIFIAAFEQAPSLLPYAQNFAFPSSLAFNLGESNNWFTRQTVTVFTADQMKLVPVLDPNASQELVRAIKLDLIDGTKPQNITISVDGSGLNSTSKQTYYTKVIFNDEHGKLITTIPLEITNNPSITITPSKVSTKLNVTEAKTVSVLVNITNPNIRSLIPSKIQWLNNPELTDEDSRILTYPDEYPQRMNIILYTSPHFKEGTYFGYIMLKRPGIDRPIATVDVIIDVIK